MANERVFHLRNILSLVSNQNFERDVLQCSKILEFFLHYPVALYLIAPVLSDAVRREVANFIIFQQPRFTTAIKEVELLAGKPLTPHELEVIYQRIEKSVGQWVVLVPFDKSRDIPPDLRSN
jgi:hypothetical protein